MPNAQVKLFICSTLSQINTLANRVGWTDV